MILKCGLSPSGVRPAVCIDECQVLLRIKHYSSVISPAQKVQVLDAVFGWTGFHPSLRPFHLAVADFLSFTFRLGKTALLPENHDMQVYQLFGLEPFPQSIYI